MDANTAAAIAAAFSALAAFLSWRAQVETVRHTFRPEIQITGWGRAQVLSDGSEVLTFQGVRNIGRDTARRIIISGPRWDAVEPPTVIMSYLSVESLAAGEAAKVAGEASLYWQNATQLPGSKLISVPIQVWCWDALGIRHETMMRLTVFGQGEANVVGAVELCRGVYLIEQTTVSVAVWRLKLHGRLRRLPLVGRLYRDE